MQRQFKQVDVFTNRAFRGNPVAVILDSTGLDTAGMQRIANWTNLSETTFLLPATQAGADYRVRIFTPQSELSFAGHPTLGTAHAALEAGLITANNGQLVQECAAGLVRLTVREPATAATDAPDATAAGREIAFELPQATITELTAAQIAQLEAALGAAVLPNSLPRLIDVGPKWIVAQLQGAQNILNLKPDFSAIQALDRQLGSSGITLFGLHAAGHAASLEVRSFAPSAGVNEDPVCGSGNGCVAAYIRESGQIQAFGRQFTSMQGACVGRDGRIQTAFGDNGAIWIGGHSVTCVDGSLHG